MLDGALDQGPVPSPFGRVPRQVVLECGLELAGGERPARGDLREYGLDELGVLERDALHATPGVGQRALHPEAQQGPGLRRDQARLVGPVLDETARTDVTGPVEQGRVVGTEAGEEREVLAAGEDVDAVDLDDADAVDHPLDVTHGRLARRWPGVGEPLRNNGDAPGLGLGQPGDVAGHVSTLLPARSRGRRTRTAADSRTPVLVLAAVVARRWQVHNDKVPQGTLTWLYPEVPNDHQRSTDPNPAGRRPVPGNRFLPRPTRPDGPRRRGWQPPPADRGGREDRPDGSRARRAERSHRADLRGQDHTRCDQG